MTDRVSGCPVRCVKHEIVEILKHLYTARIGVASILDQAIRLIGDQMLSENREGWGTRAECKRAASGASPPLLVHEPDDDWLISVASRVIDPLGGCAASRCRSILLSAGLACNHPSQNHRIASGHPTLKSTLQA